MGDLFILNSRNKALRYHAIVVAIGFGIRRSDLRLTQTSYDTVDSTNK